MRTNEGGYPVFRLRTGPHGGSDLEEISIDGKDIKGQKVRNVRIEADAMDVVRVTIEHIAMVVDLRVEGEVKRVLKLLYQEERMLPDPETGEVRPHVVDTVLAEEVGDSLSDALIRMASRLEGAGFPGLPVSDENETH